MFQTGIVEKIKTHCVQYLYLKIMPIIT